MRKTVTANQLLSENGFRFAATANLKRKLGRVPTPAELRAYAERLATSASK